MIIRRCVVLLHLLMLINEVSLQVTVEGVIGGSVVLPCSSKEPQLTTEDITVNWKHHDSLNVYAIIKGKVSVEGQDPKYKNRTESFPEEYRTGNFSLKLNDLQHSDAGKYQCYIIDESTIETVELLIKVPLQVLIVGYVGDSVVLPCSSELNTAEGITVHWRHNDSLKVYDIIKGKVSVEEQDSAYENRTESFPQAYKTGNFSLKLNNLQYNDTGNYMCHITNELLIYSMELLVKDEKDQGTQSRTEKIVTLVALLSVFILLCI
ncbi:V-set domain-containing T-cell activation inhibitor 1-like [Sinocyclocheilus rhinocerous]|uniref:V-set domain-containing T-cell activation inhibitor 1-like n=1 Tax=Sinocyclocheilus rhinocerous TaxID=307959 RepID=UPI0007B8C1C9|nr:PREDICTED: V-set domain-containing T-cell activation inhibitor 1-like [Sinocyclocheilus rhinocerous]